jgi:hypothetical protein
VVGGINLYGGTPHAFKDSVGQLAAVLHADAASAIHDADLSFTTRHQAAEAPKVLASQADIAVAIGIIASSRGIDVDSARSQLRTAAAKAGLSEHVVARAVIGFEVGGGFEA